VVPVADWQKSRDREEIFFFQFLSFIQLVGSLVSDHIKASWGSKKTRFLIEPNPVGFIGFYWIFGFYCVFWTSRKNR